MFALTKRLMYTVRVSDPDRRLAGLMLEQFGGLQGELVAAMRYFTQALAEDDVERKEMLLDIASEEMSHIELIGSLMFMLNKGAKGDMAERMAPAERLAEITQGGESHTTSLLYGRDAVLVNSAGVPSGAIHIDAVGDPRSDLRSNIDAEARATVMCERLLNVTDDPGVKDALSYLMAREIAHQTAFERALYAFEPNFVRGQRHAAGASPGGRRGPKS